MSLRSKLIYQVKSELIGRIIAAIFGGITMIALARLLGPDSYGLLFLAISVFGVAKLFSQFGIARSAGRYISKYKEQDRTQLRHIILVSLKLNIITISIVSLSLIFFREEISGIIGEERLPPLLLIGSLYIAFGTLLTYVRYILQGYERADISSLLHASEQGGSLLFALPLVILGYGAIGGLVGYIISFFVTSLFGGAYIFIKYYRSEPTGEPKPGLRKKIAEYSVPLSVTTSASVLTNRIDTILIAYFLNPIAVGYYTISKQIVQFVRTPATSLGFALSPTYGSETAKGNHQAASRIYESSLYYTLLLYMPAASGIIIIAEDSLLLIFGSEYSEATRVLQVLSLYLLLQAINMVTNEGLDYLGRARSRAIIKFTTSLLNVVLNLILIIRFGVVGAAIASVISFSLYTIGNLYFMGTELNLNYRRISSDVLKILGVTFCIIGVIYPLSQFINGIISLILVILVGVLTWGILSVTAGLIDISKINSLTD